MFRVANWTAIKEDLLAKGVATVPKLLEGNDCEALIRLFPQEKAFRKRIKMEQHNFGVGEYAYFSEPLPKLVEQLRTEFYRRLAPVANHMIKSLMKDYTYPTTLKEFRKECQEVGQSQPTPLILHYQAGGMNRLHRDLYGPTLFPFQMMVMLSQPGRDFEGGEFVMVENYPRQQSQATVMTPNQGDLVIFPVSERPIQGKRGILRASIRHGVSRIQSGERWVLGVIFHDAH